ncbi:MAG: hypothetical protein RLZZ272_1000 [Actinomycetota bacterium]
MIHTVTANPSLDVEYVTADLVVDAVLVADEVREDAGGKGVNVARALARLGVPVTALACLGGPTGERVAALLSTVPDLGLVVVPVPGETRTNVVVRDARHHVKVNAPGPAWSSEDVEALVEHVARRVRPGDWWVIAGSVPPGVPTDLAARLVHVVHAGGGEVALDADGGSLAHGVAAGPALIKPNAREAAGLVGLDVAGDVEEVVEEDLPAVLDGILALGARRVLLSLGSRGAAWAEPGTRLRAPGLEARAVSDVGAGDAMLAAAVAVLARGGAPDEALAQGVAAGAAAVALPGTDAAPAAVVDRLASQVRVEVLS